MFQLASLYICWFEVDVTLAQLYRCASVTSTSPLTQEKRTLQSLKKLHTNDPRLSSAQRQSGVKVSPHEFYITPTKYESL